MRLFYENNYVELTAGGKQTLNSDCIQAPLAIVLQ